VLGVARKHNLPADELVDRLDIWLWKWVGWRVTQKSRENRRDVLRKKAKRLRKKGDFTSATTAEAKMNPLSWQEPELTSELALFWLLYKGEMPSPGSGELPENAFIQFVTDCAVALELHPEPEDWKQNPALWRDRYRRWRAKKVKAILERRERRQT
jgi:hypothetical protein